MTKTCIKCGRVKSKNEFGSAEVTKDKKRNICRSCLANYAKAYRFKKNPDRVRLRAQALLSKLQWLDDKKYWIAVAEMAVKADPLNINEAVFGKIKKAEAE